MPWTAPVGQVGEAEPLVSSEDYAEWYELGPLADLPAAEQERIRMALDIASSTIRAGRKHYSAVDDETLALDGSAWHIILLPQDRLPVRDVTAVVEDGVTLEAGDWEWTETGLLRRSAGRWVGTWRGVEVTYSHGYDPLPRAISGVAMSIAKRWLDATSGQTGAVRSEQVGSYAVTYATEASGVGLTELEAQILARY